MSTRRSLRSTAVMSVVLAVGLSAALLATGVPLDCVVLSLSAALATTDIQLSG